MAEKKEEKQTEKSGKEKRLASARGRIFGGIVVRKFSKRIAIENERTIYVHKYERFYKKKMRIHARLPEGMDVNVGDYIKVQECRPLSNIIHHIVIEKIKSAEDKNDIKIKI